MGRFIKILLVCMFWICSTTLCIAEANSVEVDRRLAEMTPEKLYYGITILGNLEDYGYRVSNLKSLNIKDERITEAYAVSVGNSSFIIMKKYKPKGDFQGNWRGDPVVEAFLYEDDMINDKNKNPGFRMSIQIACYLGLLYHLDGRETYNKQIEERFDTLIYMLDKMNKSDDLNHGLEVKMIGPYVFDDKGNVIATLSPRTKWCKDKNGRKYQYFAIALYPYQIIG